MTAFRSALVTLSACFCCTAAWAQSAARPDPATPPGSAAAPSSGSASAAPATTATPPAAPPAAPTPTAPTPTAPNPTAPNPTAPNGGPPPHYYVEPPGPEAPSTPAPAADPTAAPPPAPAPNSGIYEPPPPGYAHGPIYEPPPPPEPRHVAPKYSLWLGGRVGWFIPFGNAWGVCTARDVYGDCAVADVVGWDNYASSGPVFELDAGARVSRNYNVFVLWEHARLGTGNGDFSERQSSGTTNTDYYAIGLRVSSDADALGLLTELTLGYRRFRAAFDDGSELQLTDAPLEVRIGLGADIRLSPNFTLTPLATVGFGSFGEVEAVGSDTSIAAQSLSEEADLRATHGWATIQMGAHFDLLGSTK